jgi:isopenicillin N synthase-like dioxygenase
VSPDPHLPVVDVGALLASDGADPAAVGRAASSIDRACRDIGFFGITGHGVDPDLLGRLDGAARAFFELPDDEKRAIEMSRGGAAWRGWFPVGGELTSGRPDRKEGIYLGEEHGPQHPRVRAGIPLHGVNLFPERPAELRDAVLAWLEAMRTVADAVMRGIAIGLGLDARWFEQHLTTDPTVLFRIFHYPPDAEPGEWGVGEHTDYGLLTLLAQDRHGGLQVRRVDGTWIDVPATPGVLVCNIGDMLERLTAGRYRSTPHRVRNTSGTSRLSFPYFFDPSWDATVPRLPLPDAPGRAEPRWDDADVLAWDGTYGDYLTAKVAKVFPDLFGAVTSDAATPRSPSDAPAG